MTDTATPVTGPVDAPASAESIADQLASELGTGGETAPDGVDSVTQELVNEAEGTGDPSQEEPATEDDATETADDAGVTEEDATHDEPTFTVKVNGQELQVKQSELLNGYSRTEDYKAKTAAVAEERRTLEAQRGNLDAELKATYASQLEQATSLFAQFDPVLAEARTINWDALKQADPAAYVQAQDAVQQRLTAIQQMRQQVETLQGQTQQAQAQRAEAERATRFDTAADKIVETMPELADPAKFQSFATDAIGYLRNEGFDNAEIADALDHRVLMLANDARQWRAHKAAQQSLPAKKIVQKSAVRSLTTDGTGSRANPPRFPAQASRDRKTDWVVNQLLSEE
jgi:hypothetical protein